MRTVFGNCGKPGRSFRLPPPPSRNHTTKLGTFSPHVLHSTQLTIYNLILNRNRIVMNRLGEMHQICISCSSSTHQRQCLLVHARSISSPICHQEIKKPVVVTASMLEQLIRSRVVSVGVYSDVFDEEDEVMSAVQFYDNDDAQLLHCSPFPPMIANNDDGVDTQTICGVHESESLPNNTAAIDVPVHISLLEPSYDSSSIDGCCCQHPRGNWHRRKMKYTPQYPKDDTKDGHNVIVIDLTKMQHTRRTSKADEDYPCIDSPGKVLHLLRSVLNHQSQSVGLHSASPWNSAYQSHDASVTIDNHINKTSFTADTVFALLVKNPTISDDQLTSNEDENYDTFWDELEETELNNLLKFRTGDAAPSYSLYSTSHLVGGTADYLCRVLYSKHAMNEHENGALSDEMLLVYRHHQPRRILTLNEPLHTSCSCIPQTINSGFVGCLWETYKDCILPNEESNDLDEASKLQRVVKHRMVSPPYLSVEQEYPGLFDSLLRNIDAIRDEARDIPQWTAWPERNHYSSSTDDDADTYPASWTVFPLCHTFPANDVSQRKFIEMTCSFVPNTTTLLKGLGPALRTALFSRLEKQTTLGTHTGWSDLANHVLRVHVPLVVPSGGLCGTWVDGCVETHDEGRVVCFDDSKIHRAYNYSNEERIVLIIDLARRTSGHLALPIGTATGGHTDELDAFVNEFT